MRENESEWKITGPDGTKYVTDDTHKHLDDAWIHIKPKRVQTGLACYGCSCQNLKPCIIINMPDVMIDCQSSRKEFLPYYGKVIEDDK